MIRFRISIRDTGALSSFCNGINLEKNDGDQAATVGRFGRRSNTGENLSRGANAVNLHMCRSVMGEIRIDWASCSVHIQAISRIVVGYQ